MNSLKRLGIIGLVVFPLLHLMQGSTTVTQGSTSQQHGERSGWFRPLQYPSGERRPYWRVGLENRRLEAISDVRVMGDGSRVYTIACRGQPPLYVWDRASDQYNSPAVASQNANFGSYATLDLDNLAFLENIHTQLLKIMPKPRSTDQERLLRKLLDATHDARRILGASSGSFSPFLLPFI